MKTARFLPSICLVLLLSSPSPCWVIPLSQGFCAKISVWDMSLMLFSKDFCLILSQKCALYEYFSVYSLLCYIQNHIQLIPICEGVTTNRWKCFIRDTFSWKCHSMLLCGFFKLSLYWQKTEHSCTETVILNFAYFINTHLKTTSWYILIQTEVLT